MNLVKKSEFGSQVYKKVALPLNLVFSPNMPSFENITDLVKILENIVKLYVNVLDDVY